MATGHPGQHQNGVATPTIGGRRPRIVAIASAGGHWVQLRRLRPAWQDCQTTYVTTLPGYRSEVEASEPDADFISVLDASRWEKFRLLRQMLQITGLMLKRRPDVVVSTGAAPGYFALRLGRLMGAKTIWVDSIANAEELSLAGQMAGRYADVWLTQWPHLAKPGGPEHKGAVL